MKGYFSDSSLFYSQITISCSSKVKTIIQNYLYFLLLIIISLKSSHIILVSMGSNFSLYGLHYRITVNVDKDFQVLALKVHKTKKVKGDDEFVFYKQYSILNLPEQFKEFKSIKELYEYLQKHKTQIKIVGTSLLIPLNGDQVYITFENKSQQSKIFVSGINQEVRQGEEALQNLERITQILSKVQQLQNHNNALQNDEEEQNDLQFIYAKLYSFYEKLCDKNPQRKRTQKLSMIQLVDQIVSQHDFLQHQRNPLKSNNSMKKSKPINQNQEQIQKLNKEIMMLTVKLETSKQTFQIMISQMLNSKIEQINNMKKEQQIKQKNNILTKIQGYIHEKRALIAKSDVKLIKVRFENEEDIRSFIQHRLDEIQDLKDELLQQKSNVNLLQKQIENMRKGSSINFSNISGDNQGGDYL